MLPSSTVQRGRHTAGRVSIIAIMVVLATGTLSACASDPSDVPAAAANAAAAPDASAPAAVLPVASDAVPAVPARRSP